MLPLTLITSKRDVWLVRMDVYPVLLATSALNAGLNTTTTLLRDFALRYVVMENVSHWLAMMETMLMVMDVLKTAALNLDSIVLVGPQIRLMYALHSYLLFSSSRNQDKLTSLTG